MNRVHIKTYGCKMNERDSEALAAMLRARGYRIAAGEDDCDIMLLNTCSVRDAAEQKAIGKAARMLARKRRNPGFIVGILGCMAQNRGASLIDRLPGIDLIIGTQKIHRAPECLDNLRAVRAAGLPVRETFVDIAEEAGSQNAIKDHFYPADDETADLQTTQIPAARNTPPAPGSPKSETRAPKSKIHNPVSAFVSIQQGCNMDCAFCIVPKTRGDERSRPIDDIAAECLQLAARGVREITLLGQIVTSYGRRDIAPAGGLSPFVQLLARVHAIDGIERIRFTSPHPRGFTPDLIDAFTPGRMPKLCEHVHLPMQSGSDRILKAMRRPCSSGRYRQIIGSLRAANPGIYFSTDVIVGFPGETDADFEQTRELFEACNYDMAYVFKYSIRTGTPAAALPGQVPEDVKELRNQVLLKILRRNSLRRNESLVGSVQEVLVEGPDKTGLRHTGRTRGNRVAIFDAPPRHAGRLVQLRVERATTSSLYGRLES